MKLKSSKKPKTSVQLNCEGKVLVRRGMYKEIGKRVEGEWKGGGRGVEGELEGVEGGAGGRGVEGGW